MTEPLSLDATQETRLVVLQLKAGVTVIGFATNISKAYL